MFKISFLVTRVYVIYDFHFLNKVTEISKLFNALLFYKDAPAYEVGLHSVIRQNVLENNSPVDIQRASCALKLLSV